MTDDLIERLREQSYSDQNDGDLINEAIDALVAKTARIEWLERTRFNWEVICNERAARIRELEAKLEKK